MPIQFPDFGRISFAEANPWLTGAQQGMNMVEQGQRYAHQAQMNPLLEAIQRVQANYAEPNAQAALKTAQQHNQYDPRIWESEIGLRNAQSPYYGAQVKKMNAEMPYIGRQAEADLLAKQLSNQKAQMEYIREKEFEDKFKNLSNRNVPENNRNVPENINPQEKGSHLPIYNPQEQLYNNQQPQNNQQQQSNPNEKIVSPGSPQLAAIDEWYENSPISRSLLEKKGLKKVQQIKIDKSGKATLVTKYPSGKVTVSSMDPNDKDENGIPLTNKMISQHQNVVASVDVAIPILDKIIDMKNSDYSRFGGWTNKGAKYASTVSQALDSLLGAFGLPQTNEGIKTIREQLEIGHNESPNAYRKRIKELKEDVLKRQKYSSGLVKKAKKINENENENDPYNLGSYDLSGG